MHLVWRPCRLAVLVLADHAREAAGRLLDRIGTPLDTNVLLVRAADWVPPIRTAALEAL
jgi:hypothetical protein